MKENIPDIDQKAPDFQVLNSKGEEFRLEETLKQKKSLLLIFYRGHW